MDMARAQTGIDGLRQRPAATLAAWQRAIAWACWLLGGFERLVYVVVLHPPAQHIYSDMFGYVERARRFFTAVPENIGDTIYPPGTYAYLGLLYKLDPSWSLAALAQWLLALGTMGLIWLIARRLYGATAGLVALVIATLYPPLVHYPGLFLSETPFTFSLLLTTWLALRAIDASRGRDALLQGFLAGAALGLASSFKNTIFLPFLLTGLFYWLYALKHRRGVLLPLGIGVVAGVVLLFAPMTVRCTRLNDGHFCLSANNIAMNVLMGHYGRNGPYHWHDAARHIDFEFESPSASLRGYTNRIWLEFGAYDAAPNLEAAWSWTRAHPMEALRLSLDNVDDLFFSRTLWPPFRLWNIDFGAVSQQLFWWTILAPAVLYLLSRARPMLRLAPDALPEWLLLLPVLGLIGTVFLAIGETRHRVPFDTLIIVLAAQAYTVAARMLGRLRGAGR